MGNKLTEWFQRTFWYMGANKSELGPYVNFTVILPAFYMVVKLKSWIPRNMHRLKREFGLKI